MAARLGIDIDPHEFSGYFLFELHVDPKNPDAEPYCKFFYNREPSTTR